MPLWGAKKKVFPIKLWKIPCFYLLVTNSLPFKLATGRYIRWNSRRFPVGIPLKHPAIGSTKLTGSRKHQSWESGWPKRFVFLRTFWDGIVGGKGFFFDMFFCSKHLWERNFLDWIFLGGRPRFSKFYGKKVPILFEATGFFGFRGFKLIDIYLSQRLFFCRWIFCVCFLWDFGGFGGPGSFFWGVVFIFSGRTLTKIAHVCSVFFLFGMFYIVLKFWWEISCLSGNERKWTMERWKMDTPKKLWGLLLSRYLSGFLYIYCTYHEPTNKHQPTPTNQQQPKLSWSTLPETACPLKMVVSN